MEHPSYCSALHHFDLVFEFFRVGIPDCAAVLNVGADQSLIGRSLNVLVRYSHVAPQHSLYRICLFRAVVDVRLPGQVLGDGYSQVLDLVHHFKFVAMQEVVMQDQVGPDRLADPENII